MSSFSKMKSSWTTSIKTTCTRSQPGCRPYWFRRSVASTNVKTRLSKCHFKMSRSRKKVASLNPSFWWGPQSNWIQQDAKSWRTYHSLFNNRPSFCKSTKWWTNLMSKFMSLTLDWEKDYPWVRRSPRISESRPNRSVRESKTIKVSF